MRRGSRGVWWWVMVSGGCLLWPGYARAGLGVETGVGSETGAVSSRGAVTWLGASVSRALSWRTRWDVMADLGRGSEIDDSGDVPVFSRVLVLRVSALRLIRVPLDYDFTPRLGGGVALSRVSESGRVTVAPDGYQSGMRSDAIVWRAGPMLALESGVPALNRHAILVATLAITRSERSIDVFLRWTGAR